MLAVTVAQWVWTLVPAAGEARGRDTASSGAVSADPVSGSLGSAQVLGVFFTPPSGAGKALVHWIDEARQEVLVQAYGFTHNAIAQALLRAGMAIDHDRPAVKHPTSIYDEYQSLPVLFTGL